MNFEQRIAFGETMIAVRASLSTDWEGNRCSAEDKDDFALKLCLIHPEWYDPTASVGQPDPRGARSFSTTAPPDQTCQAKRIWGYPCSIPSAVHADHLFPHGAGGPTDARNLVWLCEWHNRVKSDDVHLLPWDNMDVSWIPDVLERIAVRRGILRQRGYL